MRARRPCGTLAAVVWTVIICSLLGACGPAEVALMHNRSENKVHPAKHAGANIKGKTNGGEEHE